MRKLKFLLLTSLTVLWLSGCRNDSTEGQDETVENVTVIEPETEAVPEDIALPYIVTFDDNTGRLEIEKNPESMTNSYTAEQIAAALNKKYPEIVLHVGERKQDTLELRVDDATYLSQGMGSAGANGYLAEATYSFTSLDSINVVNFLFEPGDHAMPGPYSTKSFDDFN